MSRKFPAEIVNEWVDYEIEFVRLCLEKKWIPDPDEDGCPILNSARKKDHKTYKVCPWGKGLVALVVTATHGRTKEALYKKALNANLEGYIHNDGDTDLIYVFPIERLPRAVKTFNLRRKQKHPGPPKDAIKKGQEALKKYREERKKNLGKSD